MSDIKTYFCYLSGEFPSKGLPAHEVIAVLKSNTIKIKNFRIYDQILLFSSDKKVCELIARRAAYVHKCGELISNISVVDPYKIERELSSIDFNNIIKENSSFAVRIKKIKTYFPKINEEEMERKIGNLIKSKVRKSIKVDLKNPDVLFLGVFTEENFIFGVCLQEVRRISLRERAPHTRPFFHPCALDPLLARAMVNLSEINKTKTLYDPFCGSGSILIEGGEIGSPVIGSDISQQMVRGTALNLRALNIRDFHVFRADARMPCIKKISNIVTDPPYGRASSIYGKDLKDLLTDFFRNIVDLVCKNNLCVLALPSTLNIHDIISIYNFKIQNEFEYYVHRSLTRKILILKKA